MTRHTAYDRIGNLLTEEGYESVTEYLMEGNSSELLTEEQLSALLAEHYEEELIESLSEEDRLLLVEALITEFSVMNKARGRVIGGAIKKAALYKVGPTWGQVGDKLKAGVGHVARFASAKQFEPGSITQRGIARWKGAVKGELKKEKDAAQGVVTAAAGDRVRASIGAQSDIDAAEPRSTKTGKKVTTPRGTAKGPTHRTAELPQGGIAALRKAQATVDSDPVKGPGETAAMATLGQHKLPPEHGGPARAKKKKSYGAFGKALRGISNDPKQPIPGKGDDEGKPPNAVIGARG